MKRGNDVRAAVEMLLTKTRRFGYVVGDTGGVVEEVVVYVRDDIARELVRLIEAYAQARGFPHAERDVAKEVH